MNNPAYTNASLYVGDLLPDVNETQLFETFKQAGAVASIRVCRDAVTRRSLGYAYVNFHNSADANRAIELLNFKDIKGKPCRIMSSQRDPSLRRSNVGNIFIKNLHKSIDNKMLNDTFQQFGQILSAKVVTDEHGQSKGYGFVHFQTQEAADKAIELVNGKSLNGKICFVGVFVPRKEREKQQKADPKWTNIYVKPLPKNIDDEGLQKMFSKYGAVTSAAIMLDDKKEPKGFGFVNFSNHEEAEKAIEDLNGKDYEGQTLFVGRAQKKGEREKDLKEMFSKIQRERVNKYQGVNLYIKNLDEGVDDNKLRAEFSVCGTITSARIMRDDKDRSRGFGFVCFSTPEEATKAVTEFNGRMLAGKPIYVALAQKKEQRRLQLEADFNRRNAGIRLQQQAQASGMTGSPIFGPMFYPPTGRGFVYPPGPPQMGGRGGGRYPSRGMPFMPGMFVGPQGPVPQGQQQQGGGGRGGRGHRGRGGNHNQNNGQAPYPMGIKYNPNVRNPGVPQAQQPQPSMTDATLPMTPERKQQIGEALYPQIDGFLTPLQKQSFAGKITGMLLESLDLSELMQLLESQDALSKKINEALDVLSAASQIPEAKNVTQLITSKGYPCEEHHVLTEDGFILSLQRIPNGRNNQKNSGTKPVVILQHGLLDSAATFVLNSPQESLGFILADQGMDVWLSNSRGNVYSLSNIHYDKNDPRFWAWSFDELGHYDTPAVIDYVIQNTGVSKVTWIGHSRGTQMMFAELSRNPELAQKLNLFIALAPVAHVGNITSELLQIVAKLDAVEIIEIFGLNDFLPSGTLLQKYFPEICDIDPNICDNVMYILFGCCDPSNFNQTRLDVYWAHLPAGTSTQEMIHYTQMVNDGLFQMYDYGSASLNMQHYNQSTPPMYDLGNIPSTLPIALFSGLKDALGDPSDVNLLVSELSKAPVFWNKNPDFTHMDFVWGVNAYDLIYQDVIQLIQEYSNL